MKNFLSIFQRVPLVTWALGFAAAALYMFGHADAAAGTLLLALGPNGIPTAEDFERGRVTNPAQSEVIRQRLYDWNLYPTAGQTQLAFFSQQPGQGVTTALGGVAGTGKTPWDTNIELPNTLPSGKAFMIETIEVHFLPGSVSTANTYTPATIAFFNAVIALTVLASANDVNTVLQSGLLELNILSKNYLRETPLYTFPPKARISNESSIASNSATTAAAGFTVTNAVGRPYYLEPYVTLQAAMNFEVMVRWPAAVATPSGFNGRLGVYLDGFLMRASQ